MKNALSVLSVCLLLAGGPAIADNIVTIDDLTDKISVLVNGTAPQLLPDSTNEFVHFNLTMSVLAPFDFSVSRDMIEPDTREISDRLLVTYTGGSNLVDVKFASDPSPLPPQGSTVLGPVLETGAQQLLADITNFDTSGASNEDKISAASDVVEGSDVPEPSSFLLMGMGLAAMLRWRRRSRISMG